MQGHLLVRAFMMTVAARWGEEDARTIGGAQWVGIAGLCGRAGCARALAIEGDDAAAIAKLLQVHPSFHPRSCADLHVALDGGVVRCWLDDCDALREGDSSSWFALLGGDVRTALSDAIVRTVNPRARCRPADVRGACASRGRSRSIRRRIPLPEPAEVKLTKYSKGATFDFVPRRPLRS